MKCPRAESGVGDWSADTCVCIWGRDELGGEPGDGDGEYPGAHQSEVEHFGSEVYAWDVVNEPLDPSQPDCLVARAVLQGAGKELHRHRVRAARQYAPAGTKLFLNEYRPRIRQGWRAW